MRCENLIKFNIKEAIKMIAESKTHVLYTPAESTR